MTLSVALVKPDSRGTVKLRSTDPHEQPEIDCNFLSEERDVQRMLDGIRLSRRLALNPVLAPFLELEMIPGDAVGDDKLADDLRSHLASYAHPVATAPMGGPDDAWAVVDSQGAVKGVDRLRVVDASIIPDIVSAAIHPTVLMVAERIARVAYPGGTQVSQDAVPQVDAVRSSSAGRARLRIAVVTGGSGAIGSAIAKALEESGHQTITLDRGGDIRVDLSDERATKEAAELILARYGRCDVFVHCAAAFDFTSLAEFDLATWQHVQAVNVEASLWLAKAFTPGMAERHFGRIVFITSDTFWDPPTRPANEREPAPLPYIASKGALIGIMRKLARTLGPDGIAVTAVAPGLTETPGTVNKAAEFNDVVNRQALKRRLMPQDTAAVVAFLASDGAAALTGQELCVDGGLILR